MVQIGPSLAGATVEGNIECSDNCLAVQKSPGYVSPVDGEIVEWQVKGTNGNIRLEVLHGNNPTGVSTAVSAAGSGKESFAAAVPIKAGERFGVTILGGGGKIGDRKPAGPSVSIWSPYLNIGEPRPPDQDASNVEILANVKIRPAPSVESVTPASGPIETENTVTITGHDFVDVHGVSFGAFGAAYEVVSETEIVAHPFGFDPGLVPLTIIAGAGTVTFPASYTFEEASAAETGSPISPATITPPSITPIPPVDIPPLTFPKETPECHVPKLKGKTLKQAKPLLVAAHCKLGKVTKRKGVKAKRGKVVGEIPPAGGRGIAGTRVQVKLG